MSGRSGSCVVCETDTDELLHGRLCWACYERYIVAEQDVACFLRERFGFSTRTVNAVLWAVEPRVFLVGGGTPEGRIIRWIEEARDADMMSGRNLGRKTLAEIRAALPSRRSAWTLCHHCGGLGMIRGLDVLA